MIVFSDEVEQSFLQHSNSGMPGRPITKAVVEDAVRAGIKLKVYAFSSGGWAGRPDFWTDISLAGNGTNFELTSNALSMYNDLMSIIDEACLPRQDDAQALMCLPLENEYRFIGYEHPWAMPASFEISK